MMPARPLLTVIATPDGPTTRLHRVIRHREVLRPSFLYAWARLPKNDPAEVEAWASAALELIEVNAGPSCYIAFWSVSASGSGGLDALALSGRCAAELCRHAGARATQACLEALPGVLILADRSLLRLWWDGLQRLARVAADCVPLVAARAPVLLADRRGEAFADFVAAGLKAYAHDAAKRRAFFALEDPWARALLARRPGLPGFEALSRLLSGYTTALWGEGAVLRAAPLTENPRQRAALAGQVVLLPAAVAAETAEEARRLYLAMVAHATAHLAQPPVRHAVGQLKPMQLAVIGLVEDARVETLAIRSFPGLARLWAPFHKASPSGARTAPALMARLARALFDPDHPDTDGFVTKGRTMFADEAAQGLEDAELSLRIGRVLGHDLGQMRVQFNWRDYVVEPAYRDDGSALWQPPEDAQTQTMDLMVQAARSKLGGDNGRGNEAKESAGRARDVPPEDSGAVIATYPEWDAATATERPDWTVLRNMPARLTDPTSLRAAIAAEGGLRGQIRRLVRGAVIGQPVRLRRQPDGDELDVDAAIEATIALRSGTTPDLRLFHVTRPRNRDLATLIMLDVSASTGVHLPDGRSILDVERLAVAILGEALEERGDTFALRAFASDGREDVRLTRIKDFGERFDGMALGRLAGLRSGLSTRLGTALRHARTEFGASKSWRRVALVLTDGEPSDVDVTDAKELVVDARRSALGLKQAGIDAFGIVLDPAGVGSATAIFGRRNTIVIRDLADLPARLAGLYFRLARR